VRSSSDRIQRSISGRCSYGTGTVRSKPSSRAYITKKAYVFQNVLMKLLATSAMISTETRFWTSGATRAVKCQRKASAPTASNTSYGLMMLPSDFDIFLPSPSTM
jgi:hypothetical protein